MRLTLHTDYALRTLIYLAVHPGDRVRIQEISSAYGISHHHLTKVVQQLQHNGFSHTVRGKGGGISLAMSPADIRVGAGTRALEPADQLVEGFHQAGVCAIDGQCALTGALRRATEAFLTSLDEVSLQKLIHNRGNALRDRLGLTLIASSDGNTSH